MMALVRAFLPHAIVAVLIIGAVAWIDHRGYARARADNEALAAKVAAVTAGRIRASEHRMTAAVNDGDKLLAGQVSAIDIDQRTIVNPTITKELSSDPRYSDPDAGISQRLLDALNRARAWSTCAARADGTIKCAVLGSVADTGPVDR